MRQSILFTKTRKENPTDEVSRNAQLLIRAGFVHKEMAGVYDYLPLGLRVLRKIENIIREEMNAIGGQEMLLTTLQNPAIWEKTGRWDDRAIDVWFKTKLAVGTDVGIGNTHEEPLAAILTQHISSYKELPQYIYQIQTKFRNELRAKSGIMRGREFLMKDLYSFTRTQEELDAFYEKAVEAYGKIFERVGLGDKTFRTFASGGAFSKFSDEFQTISFAGEDTIYLDEKKKIAVNKEVYTEDVLADLGLEKSDLTEKKAIEVGNIFKLGTKYAEAEGLVYTDEDGAKHPVFMGSYGIGLGRLMGTVVEVLSDEKGIVWPESIAPFSVHLLSFNKDAEAEEIYGTLRNENVEVLFDDRDASAGQKLSDADLLGCPIRIVVSEKSLQGGGVALKHRTKNDEQIVKGADLLRIMEKHE